MKRNEKQTKRRRRYFAGKVTLYGCFLEFLVGDNKAGRTVKFDACGIDQRQWHGNRSKHAKECKKSDLVGAPCCLFIPHYPFGMAMKCNVRM